MSKFFNLANAPATMTYGERILLGCAASMVGSGRIVEVGTLFGGSTKILRDAAPHASLHTVDINVFRNDSIIRSDEAEFFHGDAQAFAKAYPGEPIDMLFIDGDHSFRGVFNDYQALGPLLAPDATVCFHDTNHHYYGVRLMVDTLVRNANLLDLVQIDELSAGRNVFADIPGADVFVETLLEHGEAFDNSEFIKKSRDMTYKTHRVQAYQSVTANFRSNGRALPPDTMVIGKGMKGRFFQRYFGLPADCVIDSREFKHLDRHHVVCSAFHETIHQSVTARGLHTNKLHVLDDYIFSRLILDDLQNNGGGILLSFATSQLERDIIQKGLVNQPDHIKMLFHRNGFLHRFTSKFWYFDKY